MTRPWLKSISGQAWSWASLPTRRYRPLGGPGPFLSPITSRVLSSKGPLLLACPLPFSVGCPGRALGWETTRQTLVCLHLC